MRAFYIGKDQNWQSGSTTYWFAVTIGSEPMTLGVVESCGESSIVDDESSPIAGLWFDEEAEHLKDLVTEKMRED